MSWQDIVIGGGSAILTIALIPTVFDKQKPALATSLITGGMVTVFVFTFATLSLWFTAAVDIVTASIWFLLAFQRMRQKRVPKHTG